MTNESTESQNSAFGGRPRLHESRAEKQKAYRDSIKRYETPPTDTPQSRLSSLKNAIEETRNSTILVVGENLFTPPTEIETAAKLAKQRRIARWTLMIGVADLLHKKAAIEGKDYAERSAYCMRVKVPKKTALLMHSAAEKKARYKNMRTCASVWACPICGARIGETRRHELAQGLEQAVENGWQIFMLTFTLQHTAGEHLREVLDTLKAAYTDFRQGKAWVKIATRLAIVGSVQGKEVTYGKAGWHPHLHVLFISSLPEFPAHTAEKFFKERWQRTVAKHGGYATYENGLLLTLSTDVTLAEYPAKMGLGDLVIDEKSDFEFKKSWSIAAELAKSQTKEGRASGKTPLQLVAAAMVGDDRAGELWLEYYDAFKGQRQLWWSQGLREKLGLGAELDDEKIAESPLPEELELMVLNDEILAALSRYERSNNARGVLLEVAASGSVDQVWQFLTGLGLERPSDEEVYHRIKLDLDTLEFTDLGEISASAAADLAAREAWFINAAGGGDNG